MSIYITLLGKLADAISEMDFNRTRATHRLDGDVIKARNIVDQIKMEMLDIGGLSDLLHAIKADISYGDLASLKEDLGLAHEEIIRLAGPQQHLIYMPEEEIGAAA